MKCYLLDTSVYGVLVDKQEEDYEVVKKIIEHAKKNREHFVTTFIIAKELDAERLDESIKEIIQPQYYLSISKNSAPLEVMYADKYYQTKKLAWSYIQKLEKKEANKAMPDALNYAWSSVAEIDAFVTRNRRGILADEYHPMLRKSNKKLRVNFVEIMRPKQFYELLV